MFTCDFRNDIIMGYGCDASIDTSKDECSIESTFTNKRNLRFLNITSSNLRQMPIGLGDYFPKITTLIINCSWLRLFIKDDLKPFGSNLKTLIIQGSSLMSIDADLFEYTTNLQHVHIESGNMENIHEKTFEPIRKTLKNLIVNFPCVGYRNEDDGDDISSTIQDMKIYCFHPNYTPSDEIFKCKYYPNSNRTISGELTTWCIILWMVWTFF